jgi:Skp family chaperone for outer membrane proteins
LGWVTTIALACFAPVVSAQSTSGQISESAILTIDSDRLFENSAFGRQIIREIEVLGAELSAENRQIESELEREERELTELRPTISPEEFRTLADAFDAKVQETRRTQDNKSRELTAKLEERRVTFLNAAAPVLEQLMREAGASVILERRSVFISANAVDVTQIAIERLDAILDGETLTPLRD